MIALRTSLQGAALVLGMLLFSLSARTQTCQLEHTLNVGVTCPEGSVLHLNNPTMECYDAVRLILENGTFSQWEANAAQGWQVEQIADNELLITNTNGWLPMEDQVALTFWHYRPGGLPDKVILLYDDQCTLEGCEWTYDLPGCGEGTIQGFIYRECGMEPLTDQPRGEGQTVELWDDQGILLEDQLTGLDGSYHFYDLPAGHYIVRLKMEESFSPNVPLSGEYTSSLLPGEIANLNFGLCPICTCDDWETILQQDIQPGDTAKVNVVIFRKPKGPPYYYIKLEPCRYRFSITIDTGEITGVTPPEGWNAEIIDALHANLTVLSEDWWNQPNPNIMEAGIAIDFGMTEEGIKLTLAIEGEGNQAPEPICEDSITLEDPTKFYQTSCCPDGKSPGPEWLTDTQFNGPGLPASDYAAWVSGPITQGQIAIFDALGAYTANNSWILTGILGSADTYLAVDGSGTPGQAAWKQTVSGVTAGADYVFCTRVANLVSDTKNLDDPVIVLEIVDDSNSSNTWTSPPLTVPENPKQWWQIILPWTAPNPVSPSYTLRILSTVVDPIGNDFALDQVSFRECITVPKDTCCKDLADFCAELDSLIVFDPDSCKVTMELGALPLCYTIEWVDWGQGPEYGPWTSSTFPQPMHTFSGNGAYPISYLAIAYDDAGFICLEKIVDDTLDILCEPCVCNIPAIHLVHNGVSYQLFCTQGAPTPALPCPAGDVNIGGFFGCETSSGELCEETEVPYYLTGPGGLIDQGVTTPFSQFIYNSAQVGAPGTYSLTLSTLCPGQTDSCQCTVRWIQEPCDTCYCEGFSDMYIRTLSGLMNQPVACGDSALVLPCPSPGTSFHVMGVFTCTGDSCAPDHQIDWTLTGPGGSHGNSFTDNDPFFGITLLPNWFSQPGLYTLTLQGICNGDTCTCEMSFQIDCPDLCPCDIADIQQLSQQVDQGFAVALANKSCKACFSPLAISDCETVEWWINAISGPPVGTTSGAQTFCTQFAGSGTYTVIMVVTRLKPDGSICEVFTHSQTVQVNCGKWPVCTTSLFPNPGLNEGAVAGILGDDGACPGWVAGADFPRVMEGAPESDDGWSVLLTGCFFNSDVLQSAEPICIAKQPVTASVRLRTPTDPIPGADIKVGRKPPGGNLSVHLGATKQQAQRYSVTLQDLLPLEDDDWYELTIPMDLTNWVAEDSCGDNEAGVSVHLAIEVDNLLSNNQGEGIVREAVLIDHLCLDGELVATDPVTPFGVYRVWPNPGREIIRVELPDAALAGTRLRLVNLTGQTVSVRDAAIGLAEQTVDTAGLPPGMYYLVIERNGMARAILRWVCQE